MTATAQAELRTMLASDHTTAISKVLFGVARRVSAAVQVRA
jgi:hypothetical protein